MYAHLTNFRPEVQLASLTASLPVKFDTPTIDKLTLLADLRGYAKCLSILQRHNDYMDYIPAPYPYKYQIRLASDLFMQLACPVSAPVPDVRIEFNPNKFNPTGSLWHTLLPMLKSKRLTRIDYAIDYPEDLSLWSFTTDRPRKTVRYHAPSGKLETLYLGTRTSANQYRIYDKAKEQETPDQTLWRIEQQFTLDTKTEYFMVRPFSDLIMWKPDTFTGDFIDDLVLNEIHRKPDNWARLGPSRNRHYRRLIKDANRVVHPPVKPVTTFQRGFPPLKEFFDKLLQ